MALNAYLKLAGVDGDSVDARHKDEIELLSFSWGISQSGGGSQDRGAGKKANLQSFNFVHKVDKASPVLFKKSCSGEAILIGLLQVRQPLSPLPPVEGAALIEQDP